MTRLQNFFRAAASGYVVLAANIIYTLLSLRMAVHGLVKEEFGVWATAVQMGSFLSLVDFGLSMAVSRFLIDEKDDRDGGQYGRMLKTTLIVLSVQGAAVLLLGAALSLCSGTLLDIPDEYRRVFFHLMLGQVVLIAASFPMRFFGQLLIVHQRYDLLNFTQVAGLIVQLGGLWICFRVGAGVYGLLWATSLGFIVTNLLVAILGFRKEYLPAKGAWGKGSWTEFKRIFSFGQTVFFISLGMQLLTATQTILVTKVMGLAAAAEWSIQSRSSLLVCAIVWRSFDVGFPAFCEMLSRGETELFTRRVNGLLRAILALTVLGSIGIAIGNRSFVELWVGQRHGWDESNNWLLGVSLIPLTLGRCLITVMATQTNMGRMPLILVAEGVVFLLAGTISAGVYGFRGFLVSSIICSTLFSANYAVAEICRRLRFPPASAIAEWLGPSLIMFAAMVIPVWLVSLGTAALPPAFAFASQVAMLILIGGPLFWWIGVAPELRRELTVRGSNYYRQWLKPQRNE